MRDPLALLRGLLLRGRLRQQGCIRCKARSNPALTTRTFGAVTAAAIAAASDAMILLTLLHCHLPRGVLGLPCIQVRIEGCRVQVLLARSNGALLRLGPELGRLGRDVVRVAGACILRRARHHREGGRHHCSGGRGLLGGDGAAESVAGCKKCRGLLPHLDYVELGAGQAQPANPFATAAVCLVEPVALFIDCHLSLFMDVLPCAEMEVSSGQSADLVYPTNRCCRAWSMSHFSGLTVIIIIGQDETTTTCFCSHHNVTHLVRTA